MFRKIKLFLFFVLLLCLSLPARAYDPKLNHVIVTNNKNALIVFGQLQGEFTDEILAAFQNGLPLLFEYETVLFRERRMWPDKELHRDRLTRTAKYDMLKEEYIFSTEVNGRETTKTTANFLEIQRWMYTLNGVEIYPLKRVSKNRRYFLKIRAKITAAKEDLSKNVLLFFHKGEKYITDWYRSPLFSVGNER